MFRGYVVLCCLVACARVFSAPGSADEGGAYVEDLIGLGPAAAAAPPAPAHEPAHEPAHPSLRGRMRRQEAGAATDSGGVVGVRPDGTTYKCSELRKTDFSDVTSETAIMWIKCKWAEDTPLLASLPGRSEDENINPNSQSERMRQLRETLKQTHGDLRAKLSAASGVFDALNKTWEEAAARRKTSDDDMRTRVRQIYNETIVKARAESEAAIAQQTLRDNIRADRKKLEAEYMRTSNAEQLDTDLFEWRLKWNASFDIAYPGSALGVTDEELARRRGEKGRFSTEPGAAPNTTWAFTMSERTKQSIIKVANEYVEKLNSTEMREWIHNATEDEMRPYYQEAMRPYANKTVRERIDSAGLEEFTSVVWRKGYAKVHATLDPLHRQLFLSRTEARRARNSHAKKTMQFKKSTRLGVLMMNRLYHEKMAQHMIYNSEKHFRHFTNYVSARGLLSKDSTARVVFNEYLAKMDATHKMALNKTRMLGHDTLFEWMLTQLSPESRAETEGDLRKAYEFANNEKFWKEFSQQIRWLPSIAAERYTSVLRALKKGDDSSLPAYVREFYGSAQREKIKSAVSKLFSENIVYRPSMKVSSARYINVTTIVDVIVDYITNKLLSGCVTELFTPPFKYCPPFIDPLAPGLPTIPAEINITDRLPINCTKITILLHKKAGAFDGFFQKVGDVFGVIFTFVPGFKTIGSLFGMYWKNSDIRRNYVPEILVCGIPEVVLFLLFVLILALLFPKFVDAMLKTGGIVSDRVMDQRMTTVEQHVMVLEAKLDGPSVMEDK